MKTPIGKAKVRIVLLNADERERKDIRVEKLQNKIEKAGLLKRAWRVIKRPIIHNPYED